MGQQVVAAAVDPAVKYKTCKIVLVHTGTSDSVIKVYPAEHESEKLFLDNTPSIERWQAIERLMQGYAKRGTVVAKPVAFHAFPDLKTVVISEEDIPVVELEGAILTKPVEVKRAGDVPHLLPGMIALENRVGKLEQAIGETNSLLARIASALPAANAKGSAKPSAADLEKDLFGGGK